MEFASKFVLVDKEDDELNNSDDEAPVQAPPPPAKPQPKKPANAGREVKHRHAHQKKAKPVEEDKKAETKGSAPGFFARLLSSGKKAPPPKVEDSESDSEDSEDSSDDAPAAPAPVPPPPKDDKKTNVRQVRKATTNVLSLNLGTLANDAPLFTGDITSCECGAAFNKNSVLSKGVEKTTWVCEFCNAEKPVHLDEEEMPKAETIDYLLEPGFEKKDDSDNLIVFCIDTSGSMCMTSEISGKDMKFKKDSRLQDVGRSLNEHLGDQYMPGQDRNVSYVSRLQCATAAVEAQLESLAVEYPAKRVAIVTFNNEVTVYEADKKAHVITGDHLSDFEFLINAADRLGIKSDSPISKSKKALTEIVRGLEERGSTALGPALLVSIGLAGRSRGSSVILCTDGMANVGLGDLEVITKTSGPEVHAAVGQFYDRAGDVATAKGVAVSVVSIKGTQTMLEFLAKLCTKTNGYNDVVDVLQLTKNFSSLLQNPVIATDVSVKMLLHKALQFHDVPDSFKSVQVGNVTKESQITFEFEMKSKDATKALEGLKELPFQVIITFTKLNGSKCVRVMSQAQKLTTDREKAEDNVNVSVLARFSTQETAKLAQDGNYTKARMRSLANQRLAQKHLSKHSDAKSEATYNVWQAEATRLDTALKSAKKKELGRGLRYHSEEEDDSGSDWDDDEISTTSNAKEAVAPVPAVKMKKHATNTTRKAERGVHRTEDDEAANVFYQASNPVFAAKFK